MEPGQALALGQTNTYSLILLDIDGEWPELPISNGPAVARVLR